MSDSIESKTESLISKLADDDYLFNKVVTMKQRSKLSEADIHYIIKNAEEKHNTDRNDEIDNIIRLAICNVIEDNIESIEKDSYNNTEIDFCEKLLNTELTLNNFEEILNLKELKAVKMPVSEDNIHSIRYKDIEGNTIAIVQINTENKKIRLQNFGAILPKQEFLTPQKVNYKIMSKSKDNGWTTEYGGINQFDGSIEIRHKDSDGNVMAAVIFKSDGNVDTVVEYEYKNGKKAQMFHTSQYGHSKTIYNDITDSTNLIIDIDTDGNICCITKGIN